MIITAPYLCAISSPLRRAQCSNIIPAARWAHFIDHSDRMYPPVFATAGTAAATPVIPVGMHIRRHHLLQMNAKA